jgi:uncharacterized protein YceH (UPF0502 family)
MDNHTPGPMTSLERRMLGVLVEKAKTTPDAYPLSLNALTTGCNQKSNRDPLMNVSDDQAEAVLTGLQSRGLVTRITGGRVDRWRHNLYEQWSVDKVELAIIAELFLRGPQTEGELRGHASRMEPIDNIETLRQKLRPLAERKLAAFLGAEGRRGTLIAHGFYAPEEFEKLSAGQAADTVALASPPLPLDSAGLQADYAALRREVNELHQVVNQLRAEVAELRGRVAPTPGAEPAPE